MANIMTRRFTLREKILLLVLILVLLVGLYFFLVHYPVQNQLTEIENERAEWQMRYDALEVKAGIYRDMKEELDEILKLPEDELTVMPKYNNIEPLMKELNRIFLGTEPSLNYGSMSTNNRIVSRPIRFSFKTPDFDKAKEVLRELTHTGWRCLLTDLTLTPDSSSGGQTDVAKRPLTVSGTITFYEFQ